MENHHWTASSSDSSSSLKEESSCLQLGRAVKTSSCHEQPRRWHLQPQTVEYCGINCVFHTVSTSSWWAWIATLSPWGHSAAASSATDRNSGQETNWKDVSSKSHAMSAHAHTCKNRHHTWTNVSPLTNAQRGSATWMRNGRLGLEGVLQKVFWILVPDVRVNECQLVTQCSTSRQITTTITHWPFYFSLFFYYLRCWPWGVISSW